MIEAIRYPCVTVVTTNNIEAIIIGGFFVSRYIKRFFSPAGSCIHYLWLTGCMVLLILSKK